jgi:hypothetical protein
VTLSSFQLTRKPLLWLLFATVFLLSALYVAKGLKRGWVASDEGYLAQGAERVLHGELPHRDFDEGYTGGLSYLNAVAFRLLGTNLASMRYVLFLFFLAWVPAFYYVATRFISPAIAALVTLSAVAWSVPNYSAAMPSWYNLFFATFGLAGLLRYIKMERRFWLFTAGFCGGISFLFKLSGVYFVAGVLFFLLFREHARPETKPSSHVETGLYRAFLVAGVIKYEVLLLGLLRKAGNVASFLYFGVPGLAIGGTIVWLEFCVPGRREKRFPYLFRELAAFGAGVALPIGLFLVSSVLTECLPQVVRAIVVSPARQLRYASYAPPSVLKMIVGILIDLLLLGTTFLTQPRVAKAVGIVVTLGMPVALILARINRYIDRAMWAAVWSLLPVLVVVGAGLLVRGSFKRVGAIRQQQIFLVLSVTAACSLIQYPYTIPIYFCYVAPFAFLSATAIVSNLHAVPRSSLLGALCCCSLLYVGLDVTPGFIEPMGEWYSVDRNVARLELPRGGGLRIYPGNARSYEELYGVVTKHARGEYIYATPDCPEVYFLNEFRNPTRTLFDYADDPAGRTQRILAAIQGHDVNLVVLNPSPLFSDKVPADLREALEREFPNRTDAGGFEVRWKP